MHCKGPSLACGKRISLAGDEHIQTIHSYVVSCSIPTLLQICLFPILSILTFPLTHPAVATMSATPPTPRDDAPVAEIIKTSTTQYPSGKGTTWFVMNLVPNEHVVRCLVVYNVHIVQRQNKNKVCASVAEMIRIRFSFGVLLEQ